MMFETDDRLPPATDASPCELLAGTLALMTDYARRVQADVDPARRLAINQRIVANLRALSAVPGLSPSWHALTGELSGHWCEMSSCTRQACAGFAPPSPFDDDALQLH